jgi:hypothetical protein
MGFCIEFAYIHSFSISMAIGNTVGSTVGSAVSDTVGLPGSGLLVCLEIEVYEEAQVTRE